MPPEPLKLRDHIYKNIKHSPLTTLDLLNNNNVMVQAGLTTSAPQLEVLRVGSGRLLYLSEEYPNSRACIVTELFLHKNLREIVIDFPQIVNRYLPRRVRSPVENPIAAFGRNIWRSVNRSFAAQTSMACIWANLACRDIMIIPCGSLHDFTPSDIRDDTGECYRHVRIPLSPALETFVFSQYGVENEG